jgi:predicted RNA-binding Zn ribbon-like protein
VNTPQQPRDTDPELTHTDLGNADLGNADLENADLEDTDLENTDLENTELIVEFVNSHDLSPYTEAFDSPSGLISWLAARGLVRGSAVADEDDVEHAIGVREALRTLLAAHNEVEVETARATAALDEAARRAGLGVRFTADETQLVAAADGVDGALGLVLAAVAGTMADDTWSRLKACRDETCLWAYLDTAKNRSRAWCSMRSCGNRAKVRAYRERQAT